MASGRAEESIDGGGGDLFEGFEDGQRERGEGVSISGKPQRQDDLEAFRAGEIGGQPDFFKGFEDRLFRVKGRSASFFGLGLDKPSEPPQ